MIGPGICRGLSNEESSMNFTEAVKTCLRKYVEFGGRAPRSEFWWFALFQFILSLLAQFIDERVYVVVALALLLPSIAVGARRLHDIGRNGWYLLINFIPVIGTLVLIYFWVQPTQPESNPWGPPPL